MLSVGSQHGLSGLMVVSAALLLALTPCALLALPHLLRHLVGIDVEGERPPAKGGYGIVNPVPVRVRHDLHVRA